MCVFSAVYAPDPDPDPVFAQTPFRVFPPSLPLLWPVRVGVCVCVEECVQSGGAPEEGMGPSPASLSGGSLKPESPAEEQRRRRRRKGGEARDLRSENHNNI